ncbi:MAG: tetratricopeptide repeat protein [Alphaproteobacteria bacterium]|nr:tetratricopeptide repeat protein [Alphaproteobacteria bacterium]
MATGHATLMATALMLVTSGAVAQDPSTTIEAQFDRAFRDILADPANLDKTFRYAELAIQAQDFEAAISALERMLLFNPDLPRVRLELGVLYFRLGSYAIARAYLTRAVEGPNVPDDVKARVAVYLEEIDKRLSPHRLSGSVYGGVRYQTNANSAPTQPGITLNVLGAPVTVNLDSRSTKKNDYNFFASGTLRHTYDPQLQSGDVFESELLVYVTRQNEQHQTELTLFEFTSGPRAQFWRDMVDDATIRPYVIGNYAMLEDADYFNAAGGGINFTKQFTSEISTELNFQGKQKNFQSTAARPTANQQDSFEQGVRFDLRYQFRPDIVLGAFASYVQDSADAGFNAKQERTIGASYAQTYEAPFGVTESRWTSSLTASLGTIGYHSPDPTIDPNNKRDEQEWRANLVTAIPVSEAWALIANLQRTVVDSNFKNFTYTNTAGSIGASYRF